MLETDRCLLKLLSQQDALSVYEFYESNKDIFDPWEPKKPLNYYTLSYIRAILNAERKLRLQSKLVRWFVYEKNNPSKIIGTVCFNYIISHPIRTCQIGYKFDRHYHGLGYAYEAAMKSIEYMFFRYHLQQIEATVCPSNKASISLLNKLGFDDSYSSFIPIEICGVLSNHKKYVLMPNKKELS